MGVDYPLQIAWCTDPADARDLALFFGSNVDPRYISHSELQGRRAIDVGRWQPDLVDIVEREIAERVGRERGRIDGSAASYPVLAARRDGRLVGLALVSFFLKAP